MYEPISIALTLISVEITPAHEKTVIVFVPSSTIRLDVEEGTAPKADLVAFFAPRAIAHEVIVRNGEFQHALPSTHEIDRKSTRLNSSHSGESRMPSSA